MSDVESTLGVKIKGDSSDGVSAAEKFKRAVDEVGSTSRSVMSSVGQAFDKFTDSLGKAHQAIGFVKDALEGLRKGAELAEFAAEMHTLERNVPVSTMQALNKATDGTISRTQMLQFAMKNLHGDLHLTEQGMSLVMRASLKLSQEGFGSTIDIANNLADAIGKGRLGRAVGEYHMQIDETVPKQQQLNELLGKLHEEAEKPINLDPQLEAIHRLQAATQNWIDYMKEGLGDALLWALDKIDELTDKMVGVSGKHATTQERARQDALDQAKREFLAAHPDQAPILTAASQLRNGQMPSMDDLIRVGAGAFSAGNPGNNINQQAADQIRSGQMPSWDNLIRAGAGVIMGHGLGGQAQGKPLDTDTGQLMQQYNQRVAELQAGYEQKYDADLFWGQWKSDQERIAAVRGLGKTPNPNDLYTGHYEDHDAKAEQRANVFRTALGEQGLMGAFGGVANTVIPGYAGGTMMVVDDEESRRKYGVGASLGDLYASSQEDQARAQRDAYARDQYQRSAAERLGLPGIPVGGSKVNWASYGQQMDNMQDTKRPEGAAWSTFTEGMSAAVDAVVSGNESMGKAFARAAATKARAIAVESGLDALKFGYLAIAALAEGDPAAAAAFGLAAAKAAAVAIAAGGASALLSSMGGGAASSPRTPAGGGFNAGAGAAGGGSQTINVNVYGATTAGDHAQLGEVIVKAIDQGKRAGRVTDDNNVTVRFN